MLQHYNSILPRIMPKFIYPNFFTVFFIVFLFIAKISTAQNEVPFEVNIKEIEYIDASKERQKTET